MPFLSVENEIFTEFETFKYYKQNIIGAGGNNIVYYGKDIKSNQDLEVKSEFKEKRISDSINKANILNELKGLRQIPEYYFHSFKDNKYKLAESLCGPSLKSFFKDNENTFSPIIVCIIGIQITNLLKKIHKRALFIMILNLIIFVGVNFINLN